MLTGWMVGEEDRKVSKVHEDSQIFYLNKSVKGVSFNE